MGFWKGQKERTLQVQAVTEKDVTELEMIARELCKELQQEAIMLEIVECNINFVTQ